MKRFSGTGILVGVLAAGALPAPVAVGDPPVGGDRSLYVTGLVSNDVTVFAVGADGRLTRRARHVPTGGGSRGIVISPDGRTAFVAVGFDPGTQIDTNEVASYRVEPDGGLTPLFRAAANGDPVSLAITPDGRTLVLTNRSSDTLSTYSVAPDGRLAPLAPPIPSGGVEPLGVVVTPDGRFVYVSHRGEDELDIDRVTGFAIGGDGRLSPLPDAATIGLTGGAMAVTPDGRFLYVPCTNSEQVFAFHIGDRGGLQPVPGSPFHAPDLPVSAAVTPDGRHLYVADGGLLDSGSRLVTAYSIAADGALTTIDDFRAGKSPVALMAAPDGRHLYVSNIDSDDVSAFRIGDDGRLAEIRGSPFSLGRGRQPALQAVAISPP